MYITMRFLFPFYPLRSPLRPQNRTPEQKIQLLCWDNKDKGKGWSNCWPPQSLRPILVVSTNMNMEWKLAHKMVWWPELASIWCSCLCATQSLWAYVSARHGKFFAGTGYESDFAHGIKMVMRKIILFKLMFKLSVLCIFLPVPIYIR
jgi:hypothetical protein